MDRKRLIDIAAGREKADLVIKGASVVDVLGGRLLKGDVAVADGVFVGVGEYSGKTEVSGEGKYVMPSFYDAHLHFESVMVRPSEYLKRAVPRGVTSFNADPHEIANVLGLKGIKFMMDDVRGIAVDNFSLRGASGLSIRNIPLKNLSDFNRLRPYDLIVVQYGLNVATERGRNYDAYAAGMKTAIAHLKEAFPSASILVVSVGDRDYKDEQGELRTMPGIRNLVRYQQHIAAESAVAFWNLFEAMGGNGSMAGMVEAKPSLANRDYTHINFRGGKHLAGLLYDVLVYGKEQYDRRRAYEGE